MPKPILDLKKTAEELAKQLSESKVNGPVKKSKEKTRAEILFEYINKTMNGKYHGIGLHSVRNFTNRDSLDSILRQGLKLKDKEGVLSTVSSFGMNSEINSDFQKRSIIQYSYGNQTNRRASVIVLVPAIISNSKGESIYLGFPEYDTECRGNNYRTSCVLDSVCKAEGKVPKEFILGYFTEEDGTIDFVNNTEYYSLLDDEKKDDFFSRVSERIQGRYREISDLAVLGDAKKLENLADEERKKSSEEVVRITKQNVLNSGLNQEAASSLAETTVKMNKDDSATQALVYVERVNFKEKKKELKESYSEIKTSDLSHAKGLLRRGKEPLLDKGKTYDEK